MKLHTSLEAFPQVDAPDFPQEEGARWQDPASKLSMMETLVPELYHMALHFNEALKQQTLTGRVLTPRPRAVEVETTDRFDPQKCTGSAKNYQHLMRD